MLLWHHTCRGLQLRFSSGEVPPPEVMPKHVPSTQVLRIRGSQAPMTPLCGLKGLPRPPLTDTFHDVRSRKIPTPVHQTLPSGGTLAELLRG